MNRRPTRSTRTDTLLPYSTRFRSRFMMEFVNAMRANETMMFKARLRAARLLLIDDIQFIAGKGSTQEEFLHTINDLIDSGARIVVTADRAPQIDRKSTRLNSSN